MAKRSRTPRQAQRSDNAGAATVADSHTVEVGVANADSATVADENWVCMVDAENKAVFVSPGFDLSKLPSKTTLAKRQAVEDRLRRVVAAALECIKASPTKLAESVASTVGKPVRTVERDLQTARRRGLLPPK